MILEGFNNGISIGSELQDVLRTIAATIPSEISPLWINWIIVKTSVTAPLMYMCVPLKDIHVGSCSDNDSL